MSQTTPRLDLPLIQPAQAQKHVTHNEGLRVLDVITQLTVEALDATTPPPTPAQGATFGIGNPATGLWSGHEGQIATWFDSAWDFLTPRAGWLAVVAGERAVKVHDGTTWRDLDRENLPGIGINTTSDATNRLAVSAPATLLSHEGAGHQLKINKSAATDTASLLFQTNWSGRAEMGLAGSDVFTIKVSSDGAAWDEVLSVAPGAGVVTTSNMVGTVNAVPSAGNAVIETGSNADGSYTKLADGTLTCHMPGFASVSGSAATWTLPATFADAGFCITATVVGSTPAVVTVGAATTGSVDIETFDLAGSNTVAPAVNLIAIGRWF
ncbi:DUF2793 domain-containing protein [Maritimibacter sp. DP1N21-5]|uniref:DUF2793 domain-containing protein n=1 Tax=Maritimibacter sp. DP1N21-5 TaxID=2836867 RepID=UPI001C4702D8|nr:DUF2793 domain-containing protein [Maritimibacter sp. DP1N21-5]MBV7411080.1 DUF2793 domain-containing protein [Maritimibacter sp. DP1N21-5]